MSAAAARRYRSVAIETARPGGVLLALYDGAIRFCREGAGAIRAGDRARKGERLGQAMAILGELQATLDHERAPDLCARLEALYAYMQDRLSQANAAMDAAAVEEVVRLCEPLRDAWREAVARAGQP